MNGISNFEAGSSECVGFKRRLNEGAPALSDVVAGFALMVALRGEEEGAPQRLDGWRTVLFSAALALIAFPRVVEVAKKIWRKEEIFDVVEIEVS